MRSNGVAPHIDIGLSQIYTLLAGMHRIRVQPVLPSKPDAAMTAAKKEAPEALYLAPTGPEHVAAWIRAEPYPRLSR
jgi:hypothetical protein